MTHPYTAVSSAGLHLGQQPSARESVHADSLLAAAEEREAMVLTSTFRGELLDLMRRSERPDNVLRLGLALYSQALKNGDTSLCVEVLEKAAGRMNESDLVA